MARCLSIIVFIFLTQIHHANTNPEWGPTGHRTMGEIAESHLNKKTKKEINKLLGGQSLAFIATYGDEIKSYNKFRKFDTWHYVNFPFNTKYLASKKHPKGD